MRQIQASATLVRYRWPVARLVSWKNLDTDWPMHFCSIQCCRSTHFSASPQLTYTFLGEKIRTTKPYKHRQQYHSNDVHSSETRHKEVGLRHEHRPFCFSATRWQHCNTFSNYQKRQTLAGKYWSQNSSDTALESRIPLPTVSVQNRSSLSPNGIDVFQILK